MNIKLDIKNKKHIRKLVLSGLFLALCLLLPFVTGQIQQIGQMLAPMHLPVLLCGVVCGPLWGAAVGLTAPLLRYALFGMPPIFPMGLSMAFELCTYGLVIGLMYKLLPKKPWGIYLSLLTSMTLGRVVWGCARLVFAGIKGGSFTFAMFISGAFTTAVPGIICQIVLVPLVILLLQKYKLLKTE